MKRIILLAMLLATLNSTAQKNMGLGVRFGDPTGISFKKYLGDNALEVNLGRTHWFYGNGWYNNRFDRWYKNQKNYYSNYQYLSYKSNVPVGIQVHYLFHKPLQAFDGWDWYFGLGGQLRYQTYKYNYRYKVPGDPNWYYVNNENVTDLDLGVDGVIGMEYTFDNAPVSLFLELDLFLEIADDPFFFWWQGGVGARYNF